VILNAIIRIKAGERYCPVDEFLENLRVAAAEVAYDIQDCRQDSDKN